MSEPTVRSRTVLETRISPVPAAAITRAPMWTAIPPTSAPRSSLSPVWRPARISRPNARSSSRSAVAQRTPLPGPSKVARMPSPVDLISRPPVLLDEPTCHLVVCVEEPAPSPIPEFTGPAGGIHDIGEEHRGQHPIRLLAPPDAGQELLHRLQYEVGVFPNHRYVRAWNLQELRPLDVVREVAPLGHGDEGGVGSLDDQRWDMDGRQEGPRVRVEHGPVIGLGCGGAGDGPEELRVPLPEPGVLRPTGYGQVHLSLSSPHVADLVHHLLSDLPGEPDGVVVREPVLGCGVQEDQGGRALGL